MRTAKASCVDRLNAATSAPTTLKKLQLLQKESARLLCKIFQGMHSSTPYDGKRTKRTQCPRQRRGASNGSSCIDSIGPKRMGIDRVQLAGSRKEWTEGHAEHWDVMMTAAGRAKLAKAKGEETKVALTPGKDYKIKQGAKSGRAQYPVQSGAVLRHGWFLQRRRVPHVPCFAHCPVPARLDENVNDNARLTMAYFRAWTLDARRRTENVVHVTALRAVDESWEKALRDWLLKLRCQETKDYIGNFMSVYRVRPAVEGLENCDDEEADAALHLQPGDLEQALRTKLSSHGKVSVPERKEAADDLVAAALQKADEVWATEKTQVVQADKTANTWAEVPAEEAIRAAKKRKSKRERGATQRDAASPTVAIVTRSEQEQKIDEWVQGLDVSKCNAEQKDFCERIAARVVLVIAARWLRGRCRNGGAFAMGAAWRAWHGQIIYIEFGSKRVV